MDIESPDALEAIRRLLERGTVLEPSLARMKQGLHVKGRYVEWEPGVARVPIEVRTALEASGLPEDARDRIAQITDRTLRLLGALHKAGIPIVVGTDLAVPGFRIYRELELAVRAGRTPMEAIQAATVVPARAMKLERAAGTVEAGKRADLIVVDGNPLEDISQIRRVSQVVRGGNLHESAAIWRAIGFSP